MSELSDMQLVREYVESRSETAFAELVQRHVDHVYSAALRLVQDPHLAQDVSQAVFLALARGAAGLRADVVLSAWLHQTTRNVAAQTVRTEVRRRMREQERFQMDQTDSEGGAGVWGEVSPHLDAALGELSELDRNVVLLRYFERKSARVMAAELGTSEEAAQKRVNRAVDRLRELLAKRGVVASAGGLGAVLATHAVQAAPVGLATSISVSVAASATGAVAFQTAVISKTIAMTTLQKTLVATAVFAAIGFGVHELHEKMRAQYQLTALRAEHAELEDQVARLGKEHDETAAQLTALKLESSGRSSEIGELARLRAENARLRKASMARSPKDVIESTRAAAESWLSRVQTLKAQSARFPGANLPELSLATEEDWLEASRGELDTDEQIRRAMSGLRRSVENIVVNQLQAALTRFIRQGGADFPQSMADLEPYLEGSVTPEMLKRWKLVPAKEIPSLIVGGDFVITQEPVDREFDQQWGLGPMGFGTASYRLKPGESPLEH